MGEEKKEQVDAEAKTEEKKEEKTEEVKKEEKTEEVEEKKEEEQPPQPPPPFVLFVDLHCVGCAKKIERSLLKIRGVEEVKTEMAENRVTIKGIVEPEAVCKRIMKKTKRRAKVLSPLPPSEGEPLPQLVTSQVSGLTTVELNVNMHCLACAEQLKRKILKMRGVQNAETELATSKVTVTGTMDPEKLVEYVYRRTKKQAQIVPQPEPEKPPEEEKPAAAEDEKKEEEKPAEEEPKKEEEKGSGENKKVEAESGEKDGEKNEGGGEGEENDTNNNEEENLKKMIYYYEPLYVIERIPPPQLFSDENPNACCIS